MGDGNKVEFLVAVCALITSIMAVYMAWDQGRVMRAQQHGSVFPVLQVDGFGNYRNGNIEIGLEVSNSGVGPALIESVEFFIENEGVDSISDYVSALPEERDLLWSVITGRALAPGATIRPLYIYWPAEGDQTSFLNKVSNDAENWRLEICYCSVFDRCWKTQEIGQSRAVPVDHCRQNNSDIFEQLGRENLQRLRQSSPTEETPR